jgi:dihydrofolate reductase
MTVNLIAGVGRRGQIGRGAFLPWSNHQDMMFFRDITMGGVLIIGARTANEIEELPGRIIMVYEGVSPERFIVEARSRYLRWKIWIAGGAKTYRDFAPFVDGLKILSAIDYDNDPADDHRHVFFPFDAYGIRWA